MKLSNDQSAIVTENEFTYYLEYVDGGQCEYHKVSFISKDDKIIYKDIDEIDMDLFDKDLNWKNVKSTSNDFKEIMQVILEFNNWVKSNKDFFNK